MLKLKLVMQKCKKNDNIITGKCMGWSPAFFDNLQLQKYIYLQTFSRINYNG